jgi:hypothetical protein
LKGKGINIEQSIENLLEVNGIKSIDDRKRAISEYSGEGIHDLIAEAVSDALTMRPPRDISLKIYNALKLLYGRY